MQLNQIIDFFSQEFKNNIWMTPNDLTDLKVTEMFIATHSEIVSGENTTWRESLEGKIAEIITVDLFSRCIYRDDPKSFVYDPLALYMSQNLLKDHPLNTLDDEFKKVAILPFIHSESKIIHDKLELMLKDVVCTELKEYALSKSRIIKDFGRFPYRNSIIGRESTPEEHEYLMRTWLKSSHWSDEISSIVEDTLIH